MISYEDLCQALDRFNARRRNADEMASLEGAIDGATSPTSHRFDRGATGLTAEDRAAGAADAHRRLTAAEGLDDEQQAGQVESGFAAQPPEDTHEIDVDDVMVEDRLSDDKLPGD